MSSQISSSISNGYLSEGPEFQELAEQIKVLVTLQGNRDVRLFEHAETQLSLFERIQNRLDEIDLRLEVISPRNNNPPPSEKSESSESAAESANLSMPGWHVQREQMLLSLANQDEMTNTSGTNVEETTMKATDAFKAKCNVESDPFEAPMDASQEDLNEIEKLKLQLNGAIREMELECSVLRAKLCQEKQRLEEKEAALAQREKNLGRQSGPGSVGNKAREGWLFSRLKGFLGRP
jgi:hypothetical protein